MDDWRLEMEAETVAANERREALPMMEEERKNKRKISAKEDRFASKGRCRQDAAVDESE